MSLPSSHSIELEQLDVIYQIPLRLGIADVAPLLQAQNPRWARAALGADYDIGHRTFFHPFCGEPIFGDHRGENAQFQTLKRSFPKTDKNEPSIVVDLVDTHNDQIRLHRFFARTNKVELRTTNNLCAFLDLSVLGIEMSYLSVCTILGEQASENADQNTAAIHRLLDTPIDQSAAGPLSLADGQRVLEYARRVYCRRWPPRAQHPSDVPMQVTQLNAGRKQWRIGHRTDVIQDHAAHPVILPWLRATLAPLAGEGAALDLAAKARVFDEDRAYMFSHVKLRCADGQTPGETLAALSDGELFRLAEADGPGAPYPYAKDFIEKMKPGILYDRHAPDVLAGPDRATRFLFTDVHFCAVTAGNAVNVWNNIKRYYRHMQFMCIFEVAALLSFSKRITDIVRQRQKGRDDAFTEQLNTLRSDFLTFTHVHHFTNVSNQIQPREMFARMAEVTGATSYHREVEEEIRSASDFALAHTATRQAQAANKQAEAANALQEILSVGVPAGIVAGLAGMNVLIGHPGIQATRTVSEDLFQLGGLTWIVYSLWYLLERNGPLRRENANGERVLSVGLAGVGFAVMLGAWLIGWEPDSPLECRQPLETNGEICP